MFPIRLSPGEEAEMNLRTGKITVVVYLPWTQEVASSNLAFQTIGSISIVVSAFGFLPDDKGSIPLWNTKGFVAQAVRVSVS